MLYFGKENTRYWIDYSFSLYPQATTVKIYLFQGPESYGRTGHLHVTFGGLTYDWDIPEIDTNSYIEYIIIRENIVYSLLRAELSRMGEVAGPGVTRSITIIPKLKMTATIKVHNCETSNITCRVKFTCCNEREGYQPNKYSNKYITFSPGISTKEISSYLIFTPSTAGNMGPNYPLLKLKADLISPNGIILDRVYKNANSNVLHRAPGYPRILGGCSLSLSNLTIG